MLIRALAVRHKSNASGKAAPEFAIGGILTQLSVVAERLGETQRALMYQLKNHLLVQADAPERGETFNTEVAPQTLVRITVHKSFRIGHEQPNPRRPPTTCP